MNIFGSLRVFGSSKPPPQKQQPPLPPPSSKASMETIDFTYVTVSETDADEVDIILDGHLMAVDGNYGGTMGSEEHESKRGDILTLLLSGAVQQQQDGESENESLVVSYVSLKGRCICQLSFMLNAWLLLWTCLLQRQCEEANHAAVMAADAKREGDLQGALEAHARAAKQFHEAAALVKDRNGKALLLKCRLLVSESRVVSLRNLTHARRIANSVNGKLPAIALSNASQVGARIETHCKTIAQSSWQ
jgi:hypothetical protein